MRRPADDPDPEPPEPDPEREPPVEPGSRRDLARRIDRRYVQGELVVVARGRNQAEADLIANLLLEQGVPSLVRRSSAFDVPEMLAAGQRDVLVPSSGERVAREMLLQSGIGGRETAPSGPPPGRLLAGLLAGTAVVALVVWLGSLLAG
ncbi:MAG: hypothetical protein LT070_00300 [Solirubrobacteraceae bacterium]|nr:hypothetical protein [Solirubrobacteraceae bacterium]